MFQVLNKRHSELPQVRIESKDKVKLRRQLTKFQKND